MLSCRKNDHDYQAHDFRGSDFYFATRLSQLSQLSQLSRLLQEILQDCKGNDGNLAGIERNKKIRYFRIDIKISIYPHIHAPGRITKIPPGPVPAADKMPICHIVNATVPAWAAFRGVVV
jgi:hypothetical protein